MQAIFPPSDFARAILLLLKQFSLEEASGSTQMGRHEAQPFL
jgi:hypothetical protein